jgi:VanZ family protein
VNNSFWLTEINNMFNHLSMQNSDSSIVTLRRFLYYHLPMILYAGAIIVVSSIPDLRTPEVRVIAFDKAAHFVEYALFAFLTFRSFSDWKWMNRLGRGCIFSALFLTLFAVFDESYQSLIPGRFASVYDVLADLGGALLVLAFFEVRRRRLSR